MQQTLPDLALPPRVLLGMCTGAEDFPLSWRLGQGPGGTRVAALELDNLGKISLKRLLTNI